jgi:hypothetical protein
MRNVSLVALCVVFSACSSVADDTNPDDANSAGLTKLIPLGGALPVTLTEAQPTASFSVSCAPPSGQQCEASVTSGFHVLDVAADQG